MMSEPTKSRRLAQGDTSFGEDVDKKKERNSMERGLLPSEGAVESPKIPQLTKKMRCYYC